jgi:hypothetical protein
MYFYYNDKIKKLAKCKYQDNLELIQWFKLYYESKTGIESNKNGMEYRRKRIETEPMLSRRDKIIE